ncbi:hypothetical protein KSP40_PGU022190 [Platanthera guangdongensis]|uniref:Uncharacterized protein n=1 Tax=Platanthera guangdongensis TaxID=2320717 RepID=A0ABR2MEH7_9ASPA
MPPLPTPLLPRHLFFLISSRASHPVMKTGGVEDLCMAEADPSSLNISSSLIQVIAAYLLRAGINNGELPDSDKH